MNQRKRCTSFSSCWRMKSHWVCFGDGPSVSWVGLLKFMFIYNIYTPQKTKNMETWKRTEDEIPYKMKNCNIQGEMSVKFPLEACFFWEAQAWVPLILSQLPTSLADWPSHHKKLMKRQGRLSLNKHTFWVSEWPKIFFEIPIGSMYGIFTYTPEI